MRTFSSMWTAKLGEALAERCAQDLPMAFYPGSVEARLLEAASYRPQHSDGDGREVYSIPAADVPVFVQKLLDGEVKPHGQPVGYEDWADASSTLAGGICLTLDISLL